MKNNGKRWMLATVAIACCAAFAPLHAQTNEGQIVGTVADASGAVVPGASVEAKSEQTGSAFNVVSTSSGNFRFPAVALGTYTVTAAAAGFRSLKVTDVVVQIGSATPLTLKLAVGETSATIEVQSNSDTIETQTSDVGGVITQKQIEELPLALGGLGQFRAIESFVFLTPGSVGPGTATAGQGSSSAQGAGIYLSKIGGGQNFGAQVLLDGLSTYREENGSTFDELSPSVEAIREFRVTTSTPQAQYGRTSGGIENFGTKSGTNEIHGTVFDIFRNTALDANNWFSNGFLAQQNDPTICSTPAACQQQYRRAVDQKNNYGVDLGGPVRIPHLYNGTDRLFFFFAFEQFKKKQSSTATSTVPTMLERVGNFTEILAANGTPTGQTNPCTGQANLNGQIFDPATSTVVNGLKCRTQFMFNGMPNVIDPARITPLGKAIINAYPLPQTGGLTNNYVYRSIQNFANTTDTIRIDNNLTSRFKGFVSYTARENTVPFGGTAPMYPGPAGANIIQDFSTHFTRVGLDTIITPNLLNSFIFGVNRLNNFDISSEVSGAVNYAAELGIGGINSTAFPNIIPQNGVSALGASTNSDHTELHFLISDSVLYQHGRNSFRFGFDTRYTQFIAEGAGNANGQIFGFNYETADAQAGFGHAAGTGFGLAGLELGSPDFVRYITPLDPKWITTYYAGYVQDDLRLTNHLTLNLGLRYEIDTPRREARNQSSNFSATAVDPKNGRPGALVFASNCGGCNPRWADTYHKDVGPRIGFAYTPSNSGGKTVLRGGGSILYAPILYADFGGAQQQGYVYSLAVAGDGFNPALNLNTGIPAFPAPPNLDPGQLDTGNALSTQEVNYIEPSFGRNGMVSEWNLQVQQEIAKNTIFTIGYIGQAGQNLPSFLLQPNNFASKYLALGDKLQSTNLASSGVAVPYAGFNGTVGQALRPFPQFSNLTTPSAIENVGHTSYHALIANLSHRITYGLTFDASYTWSKTLTDADSAIGGINGGTPGLVQDSNDLKTAKSISIQDIPNNFVVNYLYQLPFGKEKRFGSGLRGIVNALMSGYTVGGIQRYLSGVPFSFGCTSTPAGYNDCLSFTLLPGAQVRSGLNRHTINPFLYLNAQRRRVPQTGPNYAAGPDPTKDSIFNGLNAANTNPQYAALQPHPAFYDQNADVTAQRNGGAYTFGNLPRVSGLARNFAYLQEDFVFIKDTPLFGDRYRFQFKAECLDCFNRHNFNAPDSNLNNPDFGIPTSVVGGTTDGFRRLQLTARVSF